MSYHVWSTYGLGFCVDNINTTPEKILELASFNEITIRDLRKYLNESLGEYKDEDLTLEDFYDFKGEYGERGLCCILREVICNKLPVVWAEDFNCTGYILYCPNFPWNMGYDEKYLSENDIVATFKKYIRILTDETITIDYYSVENGG